MGWLHKDAELQVTRQCKFKFCISREFIDEVECDVVPLDVCEVVMGSPYMWDRDVIFLRRANQWKLVKEGKTYLINAYKGKEKISLLLANQAKHLINGSQRLMMLVKRPREKKKQGVKNLSKLNLKPRYQQIWIK